MEKPAKGATISRPDPEKPNRKWTPSLLKQHFKISHDEYKDLEDAISQALSDSDFTYKLRSSNRHNEAALKRVFSTLGYKRPWYVNRSKQERLLLLRLVAVAFIRKRRDNNPELRTNYKDLSTASNTGPPANENTEEENANQEPNLQTKEDTEEETANQGSNNTGVLSIPSILNP